MPKPNIGGWREEFNDRFRREDGLIDKYCDDENGDIEATPDAIERFIQSLLTAQMEEVEKWVVDNHAHHEFSDEKVPKGQYGCYDKDYPYVNSMKLVKFLQSKRVKDKI